jgi:DNA-binding CsgD family transcriptional regulator
MNVTLTAADIVALEAAQRTLLSPLMFTDSVEWRLAVGRVLQPLLHHESMSTVLDVDGHQMSVVDGIPERAVSDYLEYYGSIDLAAVWSDRITIATAIMRCEWYTDEEVTQYLRSEVHNDFYVPYGMTGATTLSVYNEQGFAGTVLDGTLSTMSVYNRSFEPPGGEDRRRVLARLLHPAFEAGVRALLHLSVLRRELHDSLDRLRVPVAVFDLDGQPVHRTPALEALLAREPDRELLSGIIGEAARETVLVARPHARAKTNGRRQPQAHSREVATRSGRYGVRATLVEAVVPYSLLFVAVEPLGEAPLLDLQMIRERFGLTQREADVALLLARRMRNAEIAEALFISPHTARHHVERVLEKLGVSGRVEVGERLRRTS